MRFDYTALRRLAPGHVSLGSYSILMGQVNADPDLDVNGEQQVAMGGRRETVLYYLDDVWQVTTDLVEVGQEYAEFIEFLASTANGEIFTFDPDATSAAAVAPVLCKMDLTRKRRPPSRPGPRHYQWSFRVVAAI